MKLSIITPSFQQAQWLPTTIQSVLEQNYQDLEYIVIDGGSKDGSAQIIDSYSKHLAYWVSEADQGQSDAINKGFKKATGDVVAWINSDDYYYPNVFNKVMQIFNNNPHLVMIYGNCSFVDENGKFIRYFTEVKDFNPLVLRNYSDYIMQPTTFFKRSALQEVGYLDESLHYGMDWDLWCKFATRYPEQILYIRDLIAVNREYKNTKTSTGSKVRLKELKIINNRHKTTSLPKAALLYAGAEFHHKSKLPKLIKDKLIAGLSLSLGASKKLKQTRIHGLIPHSPYIEKNAHIHQPLTNTKFTQINLTLKNPSKKMQNSKVLLNDRLIQEFTLLKKETIAIQIPISQTSALAKISILSDFEFSKHNVSLKIEKYDCQ